MSEVKLLNCPFCGHASIYETTETEDLTGVTVPVLFCNACKIIFKVENDSPYLEDSKTYEYLKEKVIKAWNTRKPMERIVERLEELEEEYAYPDDDEYTAGHYSAYKDALKIVKEEGGISET